MGKLILFPSGNECLNELYYSQELTRLEFEKKWDQLVDFVNKLYSENMIEVGSSGKAIYIGLDKCQQYINNVNFNEAEGIFEANIDIQEDIRRRTSRIVT